MKASPLANDHPQIIRINKELTQKNPLLRIKRKKRNPKIPFLQNPQYPQTPKKKNTKMLKLNHEWNQEELQRDQNDKL